MLCQGEGQRWKGVAAVLENKVLRDFVDYLSIQHAIWQVNPDDPTAVKDEKATKAFDLLANSGFGHRRLHK